jgi:S-adenosylmethionine hydrolase
MIVTLTTDFGINGPYVGQLKGAILSLAPSTTIIDISHGVPPQDVAAGALLLQDVWPTFPDHTVHLAVVDPGVGTERRPIVVVSRGQFFVGPDNGLFTHVIRGDDACEVRAIQNAELWGPRRSSTFHGRDLFAPVAARLAMGLDPATLGAVVTDPMLLPLDEPAINADRSQILARIISVDPYGNLITNVTKAWLYQFGNEDAWRVVCEPVGPFSIHRTYGDANPGDPVALWDSQDRLEIAVSMGNAAARLNLAVGNTVVLLHEHVS